MVLNFQFSSIVALAHNMIAHEKALELISEFRMILMEEDTECGNEILCTLIAKKCALLAVQKMIENTDSVKEVYYWEFVKKEIEEY
jgi:hypothetical protein